MGGDAIKCIVNCLLIFDVISLMLAQRNSHADFLGIDINEEAANLTQNNFKKGGFSSAVFGDNRDFVSFINMERDILKKRFDAVRFGQIFCGNVVHVRLRKRLRLRLRKYKK